MADQPGFLASLGVSPVDEKDAVTAQRDSLLNDAQRAAKAQGQTASRGIEGLLTGVGQAIRGRTVRGFGQNVLQGFNEATDRDVAQATGLTIDQLRGRREIRQLSTTGANSGSFEDRIALAQRVAAIANRSGDADVLGAALKRVTDLRKEQKEFDKLKAQTTTAESQAEESDVISAFLDGKPVDGVLTTDERGVKGLNIANPDGQIQFVPFGERLFRNSGRTSTTKSDSELISTVLGKSEFNKIRAVLGANRSVLRKYDTVLSGLADASRRGDVQEIIGDAGKIVSFVDNAVRSLRGVLEAFVPGDTFAADSDLLDQWRGRANKPNASIWEQVQLPEWAQGSSSQAQNYRAQIIELAYLSARAAEPSNRGLSDNDIKNALLRLGAGSANPAVLFRRSMEVVAGGANDIDDTLQGFYGAFERRDGSVIEDAKVDQILGGSSLGQYRAGVQKLYEKFGVTITPDGRAVFDSPVDTDVNPVEAAPSPQTPDEIEQDLLRQITEQLNSLPGTA